MSSLSPNYLLSQLRWVYPDPKTAPSISVLPKELIEIILTDYLMGNTWKHAALVCHHWSEIIAQPAFQIPMILADTNITITVVEIRPLSERFAQPLEIPANTNAQEGKMGALYRNCCVKPPETKDLTQILDLLKEALKHTSRQVRRYAALTLGKVAKSAEKDNLSQILKLLKESLRRTEEDLIFPKIINTNPMQHFAQLRELAL